MLDIKLIRQQPEEVEKRLQQKDPSISLALLLELDTSIRELKHEAEERRAALKAKSREIGEAKRHGEDATSLLSEVDGMGDAIAAIEATIREKEEAYEMQLASLPNLPSREAPVSLDPKDGELLRSSGEKPTFSFTPQNHVELARDLDLLDLPRGAKLSGSGWAVYKGMGARLEWALLNYMLDHHIANGFTLWMVPHLVRPEIMQGSGQLPTFESQLFRITDDDYALYLVPTAEAALNGLHYDEILSEEELPKRYVAYTPCFRREAGAAGAGERGLIRTHQFNKVEMFAYTAPEQSEAMFDEMVASAEALVAGLGLHSRSMLLATGDMSFAAHKTVDIEVWLPGQGRYYEVSSISTCTDYQARRSKTRYRRGQEKPALVHTLNGSGLATSRLMVAILETFQREDGPVEIPHALRPYMSEAGAVIQ